MMRLTLSRALNSFQFLGIYSTYIFVTLVALLGSVIFFPSNNVGEAHYGVISKNNNATGNEVNANTKKPSVNVWVHLEVGSFTTWLLLFIGFGFGAFAMHAVTMAGWLDQVASRKQEPQLEIDADDKSIVSERMERLEEIADKETSKDVRRDSLIESSNLVEDDFAQISKGGKLEKQEERASPKDPVEGEKIVRKEPANEYPFSSREAVKEDRDTPFTELHENLEEKSETSKEVSHGDVIQLDDLQMLEEYLYDESFPSPGVVSQRIDFVIRTVHNLFTQDSSFQPSETDDGWENPKEDWLKISKYLIFAICRFSVRQRRKDLVAQFYGDLEDDQDQIEVVKLAVGYDQTDILKLLMKAPRTTSLSRSTALEFAAYLGKNKIINMLVTEMSVDADGDGSTHPLTAAAAAGRASTIELLSALGANDSNFNRNPMSKEYGQTPIIAAASARMPEAVKALVSAGYSIRDSDTEYEAKYGSIYDPVSVAIKKSDSHMLLCLLECGAKLHHNGNIDEFDEALRIAVCDGNTCLIHLLFQEGANPDVEDALHGTIFQRACSQGQGDIVRAFVNHGVSINGMSSCLPKLGGNSPIEAAILSKYYDIVQFLREKGARESPDGPKETSFVSYFSYHGDAERLKTALKTNPNVDINEMDHWGHTSLWHAVYKYMGLRVNRDSFEKRKRYLMVMRILPKHGAKLNYEDGKYINYAYFGIPAELLAELRDFKEHSDPEPPLGENVLKVLRGTWRTCARI